MGNFIARQQIYTGKNKTFDYLKNATELWTVENTFIFLKVFNLFNDHLNRAKALELFKKVSSTSKEITLAEFRALLDRFALVYFTNAEVEKEEILQILERPEGEEEDKPEEKLASRRGEKQREDEEEREEKEEDEEKEKEKKEEENQDEEGNVKKESRAKSRAKSSQKGKSASGKRPEEDEEKKQPEEKKKEMRPLSDEEKRDRFYALIGCDHISQYKNKLHHYGYAFGSHDKDGFRIPKNMGKYKFKLNANAGKTAEEVKEEIRRRNDLRAKERADRMENKGKTIGKKTLLDAAKQQASVLLGKREENSYTMIQKQAKMPKEDEKNKVSWDKLEQLSFHDLKGLDDDFKPTDLIDDNDEEDMIYLAEFNLHEDRLKKQATEANTKKIEDYGKLRNRPTLAKPMDSISPANNNVAKSIQGPLDAKKYQGSQTLVKKEVSPPRGQKGAAVTKSLDTAMYHAEAYNQKGVEISNMYKQRAQEIDAQTRKKESQMMKNLIERQDNQVKKGMQAVNRLNLKA
eukprot:TRINITY_DN4001_c0_g1_i6.p1 TRINITY_DN4001_c0_g1~~TRINITY_DN4001_c0_g1_i6.p1  ORF type:complete len:529 (-),score=240.90 TRINITY_DN4001_c0_g1_i6:80-1633(-)